MFQKTSPIIFIWIGKNFPKWGFKSLELCCLNNKKRKVILLHDYCLNKNKILNNRKINNLVFNSFTFNKYSFINQSKETFKDKFWLNTSLRLEVLYLYIIKNNIRSFFHAELDNVLFDLDDLDNKFNEYGEGIFVPRDSAERAIGSLLYCNRSKSLQEILSLYKPPYKAKNDMNAFGLYAKKSKSFFSLPTESFKENLKEFKIINPEYTEGLFDAASIGQYCFGIDPRISRYKPTKNLFINENSKIDFRSLEIFVNDFGVFIKVHSNSKKFKIYNMHIHSKDFRIVKNFLNKKSIFYSIQKKEKVIITGRHKIIFGNLIEILDHLKIKIKKLINFIYANLF